MFYAYPQRGRQMRVLSGIDIALWDLAGKILNTPVSKLLGGNFREEIPLYSHVPNADDFQSREAWKKRADDLLNDPRGYRAFKVDIHSALGINMQEYIPSISPRDQRKVREAYSLAREFLGPDTEIIVHLARDDAEMQAIAADHPAFGSAWRQRDFDVMTSPAFKQVLKDNNVVVIGWKEIQKVWPKENTK